MVEMTPQQIYISEKNRIKTRKALGIYGQTNLVLHHKDVNLLHTNIERYIEWNIDDLIILTRSDHTKLHYNEIFTEENKLKMAHPGHETPEEMRIKIGNANRGRKHTDAAKEKMRANHYDCTGDKNPNYGKEGAAKGKHWFNNGVIERYDFECPEGFLKGRLKRG